MGTKQAAQEWERPIADELAYERDRIVEIVQESMAKGYGRLSKAQDAGEEVDRWIERTAKPRLRAVTYPLVVNTGSAGLRAVAAQMQIGFDVLQPHLRNYAAREAAFLADVMGTTLGKGVAATVQQGLDAGMTVRGIAGELRDAYMFSRDRAMLVSRTETTRAWNGAQVASLQGYATETGARFMKVWLTAQDDRVREEHEEMEGEQVPIDEPFSNGLMEPSEPNCRCTLTYQMVESAVREPGDTSVGPDAGPEPEPPADTPGLEQTPTETPPFEEVPQVETLSPDILAEARLAQVLLSPAATAEGFVAQVAEANGFKGAIKIGPLDPGTAGEYRGFTNTITLSPNTRAQIELAHRQLAAGQPVAAEFGNGIKTLQHEINHSHSGQHLGGRDWEYHTARNRHLEEGMTEYLAQQRMKNLGVATTYTSYAKHVEAVEALARIIGSEKVAEIYRMTPVAAMVGIPGEGFGGAWRYARIKQAVLEELRITLGSRTARHTAKDIARFEKMVNPETITLRGLQTQLEKLWL